MIENADCTAPGTGGLNSEWLLVSGIALCLCATGRCYQEMVKRVIGAQWQEVVTGRAV